MGTNYYLETECCPSCKRPKDRLHIGKSSGGWCFSLHVDAGEGITSLADWQTLWSQPEARIVDECGVVITPAEMLRTITDRSWPNKRDVDTRYLDMNHAVIGPNGLLRHRLGSHCIGHGEGTYDLLPGEFC